MLHLARLIVQRLLARLDAIKASADTVAKYPVARRPQLAVNVNWPLPPFPLFPPIPAVPTVRAVRACCH
jgi:hypothetical protein